MSSYLDWHVGMKVVCVDAEWHDKHPKGWPCPLVANAVYTVISIGVSRHLYRGGSGHISVQLAEVSNRSTIVNSPDIGFAAQRFRPLVTRKTDISIFTAMLHGTDHTVDA